MRAQNVDECIINVHYYYYSIRHLLTVHATKALVCAFLLSKLDYYNPLLSGSPQYILDQLQNVQNSAARLVLKSCKHDL